MRKILSLVAIAAALAACNQTSPSFVASSTVTLERVETLSPAEIRALSLEQLEALGREADANLKAAAVPTPELSTQADARWPNYSYTLSVATGITFETYLSSFYRQYDGPDWSDDGCSGPTPPVIFDDTACRQHDYGYRNVPQYAQGRTDAVRKQVDERFLSNMYLVCDRRWTKWYQSPLKVACKADALIFYGGVRVGGSSAFYGTPQRY